MKSLGSFLALLGIISTALFFFDYELKILSWIGNWGENIAWAIRGGLIVIGGALFLLAPSAEKSEEAA